MDINVQAQRVFNVETNMTRVEMVNVRITCLKRGNSALCCDWPWRF